MQVINTGDSYDRADLRFLNLYAAKALKLIELADLDLAAYIGIMVVDDHTLLIDSNGTVINLADTDPSDILIVVDRADQHLGSHIGVALGCGNIIDNGFKQRFHAGAGASQIQGRDTGFG